MRFLYEYRTSDNVRHGGSIFAADVEAAYALLKGQGIRPSRLVEAPGILNKLLGKGKRWLAIAVLLVVASLSFAYAVRAKRSAQIAIKDAKVLSAVLPRHQIEGLPANWSDFIDMIFTDDVDRMLARHSQPGIVLSATSSVAGRSDAATVEGETWVATLRQVVAGMREDASGYLKLGRSIGDLETFLDERQRMESSYREQTVRRVRTGGLTKDEANAILDAVGLKAID